MDTTTGQQDTTQPRSTVSLDTPPTDTTAILPTPGGRRGRRGVSQVRHTHLCLSDCSTHALIVQAVMNNIVHALLVQALRNLVNRSGKIAQNIFDQLDRRLKSADKEQSGVRGQGVRRQGVRGQGVGGQGREDAQKKKMSKKGPSDNLTHTQVMYDV